MFSDILIGFLLGVIISKSPNKQKQSRPLTIKPPKTPNPNPKYKPPAIKKHPERSV